MRIGSVPSQNHNFLISAIMSDMAQLDVVCGADVVQNLLQNIRYVLGGVHIAHLLNEVSEKDVLRNLPQNSQCFDCQVESLPPNFPDFPHRYLKLQTKFHPKDHNTFFAGMATLRMWSRKSGISKTTRTPRNSGHRSKQDIRKDNSAPKEEFVQLPRWGPESWPISSQILFLVAFSFDKSRPEKFRKVP